MSNLHSFMNEQCMLAAIFAPTNFHPSLMDLIQGFLPPEAVSHWSYYDWRLPWSEQHCFRQVTVWCPPPELGRQVITFLLNMWVEQPATTSAVIIIPRTCSASYLGLSKYIRHIGTIKPAETRLFYPPVLPIPIEVLYLAPHISSLSPNTRMESSTGPDAKWHQAQAATVRGLPPVSIR